jgi:peptidoglycan hydrolase CwlO-like protein
MGMIGSGMVLPVATVPTALADAMAVLRVISDPKTAKANLDAWAALADQVQAAAGDVEQREKDTAAREAALGEAAKKLEADREALAQTLAAHRDKVAELAAQQRAFASEQQQLGKAHDERLSRLNAIENELQDRIRQIDTTDGAQQGRGAQLDEREKALNARASAIASGEAQLDARREKLAQALRG